MPQESAVKSGKAGASTGVQPPLRDALQDTAAGILPEAQPLTDDEDESIGCSGRRLRGFDLISSRVVLLGGCVGVCCGRTAAEELRGS